MPPSPGHPNHRGGQLKPALERAITLNKPVVLDVPMINNPVPTTGH